MTTFETFKRNVVVETEKKRDSSDDSTATVCEIPPPMPLRNDDTKFATLGARPKVSRNSMVNPSFRQPPPRPLMRPNIDRVAYLPRSAEEIRFMPRTTAEYILKDRIDYD